MLQLLIEQADSCAYVGQIVDGTQHVLTTDEYPSISSLLQSMEELDASLFIAIDISYKGISCGTILLQEIVANPVALAEQLVRRQAIIAEVLSEAQPA